MKITNAPAPILGPITRPSLLLLVGLEEGASEGAAEGQNPHTGFVPLLLPKSSGSSEILPTHHDDRSWFMGE